MELDLFVLVRPDGRLVPAGKGKPVTPGTSTHAPAIYGSREKAEQIAKIAKQIQRHSEHLRTLDPTRPLPNLRVERLRCVSATDKEDNEEG